MKSIQTTPAFPLLKEVKINLPSLKSILVSISVVALIFSSFLSIYLIAAAILILSIVVLQSIYSLYLDISSLSLVGGDYSIKLEDIIDDLENN